MYKFAIRGVMDPVAALQGDGNQFCFGLLDPSTTNLRFSAQDDTLKRSTVLVRLRGFVETPGARSCQIVQAHFARLSLTGFCRNSWRSVMPNCASAFCATLAYGVLKNPPALGHAKLSKRILRDSRLRGFVETPGARSCKIAQVHFARLSLTGY